MPELGSALRDLIERSVAPVDVEAIVSGRRRRRRRRRVGSAVVVVVIATLVTGGVLARPVHEPKTLSVRPDGSGPEPDATRTVLRDLTILSPSGPTFIPLTGAQRRYMSIAGGAVNVTDPRSGRTTQKPFPIRLPNMIVDDVTGTVVRGGTLVMTIGSAPRPNDQQTFRAYAVTSTLDRWRAIGPPADTVFPSLDPERVWLADQQSVTEVSLDGARVSTSYPLTDFRTPIAAVTGGLVTVRREGKTAVVVSEVWNPATNRVVHRLSSQSLVAGAGGDHVVSIPHTSCRGLCFVRILNLRSGLQRVVPRPVHTDWDNEAVFAPDGRHVAFVAHATLTPLEKVTRAIPASGTHTSIVVVEDLSSGIVTERRLTTWKGYTRLAWSPDGSLLFVARDDGHLDYFNTRFAHSPTRELAVPRADAFLVAVKPAPSTTTQKYEYDGLVQQTLHHSPELCVYPTATIGGPDADSCSGPLIAGWRSTKTSGTFHLVGTYDGDVFTLTEPPRPSGPISPGAGRPPIVESPCATPPGGWQVTNPGRVGLADYTAMTDAARADPDFAGIWSGPNVSNDVAHSVLDIAFTGNLDAHRAMLAQLWGGPICVVRHPHSYAELERVAHGLSNADRQLGLQLISWGPDDVGDVVHADVVAATAATRRAVDQRFGEGVVDLVSVLRPVP